MRKWVFLPLMLLIAGEAQAQYACGVPLEPKPRLNKKNEIYLVADADSFPDGWVDILAASINLAASEWNTRCSPRVGEEGAGNPHRSRHPIIIPDTVPGTTPVPKGRAIVPVEYQEGQSSEPSRCPGQAAQMCFPMGRAVPVDNDGWVLRIFEMSGPADSNGNATLSTLAIVSQGGIVPMFSHELGHILNLGHDTCPTSSLMHDSFHAVIHGDTYPDEAHCDRLEQMFEPPDPADDVSLQDERELCRQHNGYCNQDQNLWPKVRSACVWIPEVYTGFFSGVETVARSLDFTCYSDVFTFAEDDGGLGPRESFKSPTIAVHPPEILGYGVMEVSGWVWGRTHWLRDFSIWIDGWPAPVISLDMGRPDFGPCQEGFDPEYCDFNSGFLAELDISWLEPGRHLVQFFATDFDEYPMPTALQVPFYVAPLAPNQAPVAVDDSYIVSVGIGGPVPEVLNVLDNDYDPDGGVVKLTANPILTSPTQGTVERINDHQLLYTPFAHQSGPESFTYQIEDPHGIPGTATVRIRIFEVIFLP